MKYAVRIDEVTYTVEIQDLNARPVVANVDGVQIEVWPENIADLADTAASEPASSLSDAAPRPALPVNPTSPTGGSLNMAQVRAPIPGVVVAIAVNAGDEVVVGQELCTIEAMKMRNAIRSGRAGVIATVHTAPGQTVNHNALLFEFQD